MTRPDNRWFVYSDSVRAAVARIRQMLASAPLTGACQGVRAAGPHTQSA